MSKEIEKNKMDKLRCYSSAFSRRVFLDILNYEDFTHINWIYSTYDKSNQKFTTYMDYLEYMYTMISKSYRCEYVFKNEIINQLLIKKYGTKDTIAFNEFKVGNSIVDFAMMNGESKAFEIKTDLDTPKRLKKQIEDYKRIFNKCYIVVTSKNIPYYENIIEQEIGIIELCIQKGKLILKEYRAAQNKVDIDKEILMSCLRIREYENIVQSYYHVLPTVPDYEMFDECLNLIKDIPHEQLNISFLQEIKKRKNATCSLIKVPKIIRQIYLSMNLSETKMNNIISSLNKPLNSKSICISRI
jgi:hypothetical protein